MQVTTQKPQSKGEVVPVLFMVKVDSSLQDTAIRYVISGIGGTSWIDMKPILNNILPLTLLLPVKENSGSYNISVMICAHKKGDKTVLYSFNGEAVMLFDTKAKTYTFNELETDRFAQNLNVSAIQSPPNLIQMSIAAKN